MKKKFSLKDKKEIDFVFNNRKSIGDNFFVIYFVKNNLNHFRFSFSIGRKYGKAHLRNLIKRQIRSILREFKNYIFNYDFVIVVKKNANNLSYQEIKSSISKMLVKKNIIKERENE